MVSAAEITDRESLQAWLAGRPEATRQADAVVIAQRAALRVFPLWSGAMDVAWARKSHLTSLPVLRCLLTSGVARKYPTPEVRTAAIAAIAAANAAADAAIAAAADIAAADVAIAAARAAAATAAIAAIAAATAAAFAAASADEAAIWEEVRADCRRLAKGVDPADHPLWSARTPGRFGDRDSATRAIWARAPETWSFWLRWWDGALSGRQIDWALQEKVALIPNEIWEQGPGAVAAEIEKFRAGLALTKSDNAERIEINPGTGRLRLVPESALPEDIADYARRKIDKALGLFGDTPANQYTGLSTAFGVLRSALDDAANLPVELFDACASASRLTVGLARQGNCPTPEQDALVQDFLTRIREAGADILANDPRTQEVLERRNAIRGNDALIEGRQAIVAVAAEVADLSEGRLESALPDDAAVATDPTADPEARKAASFRLGGRLLRVGKIAAWIIGGSGRAIIGARQVLDAVPAIVASPLYRQAVEFILRWLGF